MDRPRRQPRLAVRQAYHLTVTTLRRDEPQHVRRGHLNRVFQDRREEHLQVIACRQHRVRTGPRRHELQIAIQLSWARRSQLPSFVYLAKRITKHRQAIDANLEHGLSQGLIESTNTKIRLLTRIAFGFHGPQPLIALALLALGSHPPQLPGRN